MNRNIEFSAPANATGVLFTDEMRASDTGVSVQIVSAGTTTTITYECSNDGVTWVACTGIPVGWITTPTPVSTSTTANIWIFMVQTRYFRARISTAGTGTVSGVYSAGNAWVR